MTLVFGCLIENDDLSVQRAEVTQDIKRTVEESINIIARCSDSGREAPTPEATL
jgi:hypothetical protein